MKRGNEPQARCETQDGRHAAESCLIRTVVLLLWAVDARLARARHRLISHFICLVAHPRKPALFQPALTHTVVVRCCCDFANWTDPPHSDERLSLATRGDDHDDMGDAGTQMWCEQLRDLTRDSPPDAQ